MATKKISLGERVRRRREALGWTRNELAEKCGLSHVSIWRIETGHRRPRDLEHLVRVLRLSMSEFYSDERATVS